MEFQDTSVVITGGGGGLGGVITDRFLAAGARVAVPSSTQKSLASFREKHSGTAGHLFSSLADLAEEDQVGRFVNDVIDHHGTIEILVHAAGGYAGGGLTEETSVAEFETMLRINLTTAFLMARAVLPVMKRNDSGRLIFIGSLPALRPKARTVSYAIAKRGVVTLTETIADEVKGTGITANVLIPGVIDTKANRESMGETDISRWVTPEEIADAVFFLASAEGARVNGSVVRMSGGMG